MLPLQDRAVDPYSSYESDNVNRLTRIITSGADKIIRDTHLRPSKLSSSLITITEGLAVKDDVLIHITESVSFDITDANNYIGNQFINFPTNNTIYLVLWYEYEKDDVPNVARYKLLEDYTIFDQAHQNYDTDPPYLFLGKVNVITDNSLATGYAINTIEQSDTTTTPDVIRNVSNLTDAYTDELARLAQSSNAITNHAAALTDKSKIIFTNPTTGAIDLVVPSAIANLLGGMAGKTEVAVSNSSFTNNLDGTWSYIHTHSFGVKPNISLLKSSTREQFHPSNIVHAADSNSLTITMNFGVGLDSNLISPYDIIILS